MPFDLNFDLDDLLQERNENNISYSCLSFTQRKYCPQKKDWTEIQVMHGNMLIIYSEGIRFLMWSPKCVKKEKEEIFLTWIT